MGLGHGWLRCRIESDVERVIRAQLTSASEGRRFANELISALQVEAGATGEPIDSTIERILLDEAFTATTDRHLAQALFTEFFWVRLNRPRFWQPDGLTFVDHGPHLRRVETLLARYRKLCGADYVHQHASGALAMAADDIDRASALFAHAAVDVPRDGWRSWMVLAARSWRNPLGDATELLTEPGGSFAVRARIEEYGTPDAGHTAILFSCDGAYFERFGPPIIESLAAAGFAGTIVIAAVNLAAFPAAAIQQVMARASRSRIALRFFDYPFSGRDLPSFAACVRFVASLDALHDGHAYVFVSDIDAAFTPWSLDRLKEDRASDTLLSLTRNRYARQLFPWTSLSGAASSFRANTGSLAFLARVVRYLELVFRPDENNWMIDQNALFAAWLITQQTLDPGRVGDLHTIRAVANTGLTDDTMVAFKRSTRQRTSARLARETPHPSSRDPSTTQR